MSNVIIPPILGSGSGGGGEGGAVESVFGRTGAIVKQTGDYGSSDVANQSNVTGATVTAALNKLATDVSGASGLGAVNVLDHGAVGDGATNVNADDTAAFQAAFQAALAAGKDVYAPGGHVYVINPVVAQSPSGALSIDLSGGKSLRLFGDGPSTVIKRKGNTNTGRSRAYDGLIRVKALTSAGGHAIFSDFRLDDNATGSPLQDAVGNPTELQWAHAIYFDAVDGSHAIKSMQVERVIFNDPVAACISFAAPSTAKIGDAIVRDVIVESRARFRADVEIVGASSVERLLIEGFRGTRLECEFDAPPPTPVEMTLTDCYCSDYLDIQASTGSYEAVLNTRLKMVNVTAATATYLGYLNVEAVNCDLRLNAQGQIFHPGLRSRFTQCTFRMPLSRTDAQNPALTPFYLYWFATLPNASNVQTAIAGDVAFTDCEWVIDDPAAITWGTGNGDLFKVAYDVTSPWGGTATPITRFTRCSFDPRIKTTIWAHHMGRVIFDRCRMAGTGTAVYWGGVANTITQLELLDNDWSRVSGNTVYINSLTGAGVNSLLWQEDAISVAKAITGFGDSGDISALDSSTVVSRRTIVDSSAASGKKGIAGDVWRRSPPTAGAANEWVATHTNTWTGAATQNWVPQDLPTALVPTGGTTNQVLGKASDTARDVTWITVSGAGGEVPAARALTAGAGLTGGGDLSADRTFTVGAGTGITVNADDVALANMAEATIKGRAASAGTGAPADLTATQVRTILNVADGATASGATGDAYATSHEADTTAHAASSIVNTPAGNIAATTVQAALNELDSEKQVAITSATDLTAKSLTVDHVITPITTASNPASPYTPTYAGSDVYDITGLDHALTINAPTGYGTSGYGTIVIRATTSGTQRITPSGYTIIGNGETYYDVATTTREFTAWHSGSTWFWQGNIAEGDVPTLSQGKVTNLTSDLSAKAPLNSPTLTGTPAAPTAAADTNSTQIATTAYVVGQAGTATPAALGTAAAGTSLKFARSDHVHQAVADATTSVKGIVQLATDGQSAANVVVQGNDARLAIPATISLSASTTATDQRDHLLTGGSSQTLTLPNPATNSVIAISNRSGGNWTIGRTGSDSIEGTAANDTLANGKDVIYRYRAANNWRRIGALS